MTTQSKKPTESEMLDMLKESLEALQNLGHTKCFDSGHYPCQCTACKLQEIIARADHA